MSTYELFRKEWGKVAAEHQWSGWCKAFNWWLHEQYAVRTSHPYYHLNPPQVQIRKPSYKLNPAIAALETRVRRAAQKTGSSYNSLEYDGELWHYTRPDGAIYRGLLGKVYKKRLHDLGLSMDMVGDKELSQIGELTNPHKVYVSSDPYYMLRGVTTTAFTTCSSMSVIAIGSHSSHILGLLHLPNSGIVWSDNKRGVLDWRTWYTLLDPHTVAVCMNPYGRGVDSKSYEDGCRHAGMVEDGRRIASAVLSSVRGSRVPLSHIKTAGAYTVGTSDGGGLPFHHDEWYTYTTLSTVGDVEYSMKSYPVHPFTGEPIKCTLSLDK